MRPVKNVVNGMQVTKGILNGKQVQILRDRGCSGVVVRRSLVQDGQLTGEKRHCVLVDGIVRRAAVAKISLNTPY